MDKGFLQAARAAAAQGEIVPLELPDISVTDLVHVKRVAFAEEKRRGPLAQGYTKSKLSTADDKWITLDHRSVYTPHATSTIQPRSTDTESPSTSHLNVRKELSALFSSSLKDDQTPRRFSSPNPVRQTDLKTPLKKSVSLPPSPIMKKRRGSRANSASGEVRNTLRPDNGAANCFGRTRSKTDNEFRPATSYTKPSVGSQSIFNDPEINPVLISANQMPMTPSNMHMRMTGFELRHRVMRRAFRLSDLCVSDSSHDQHTSDTTRSQESIKSNKDKYKDKSIEVFHRRTKSEASLEEQFQTLRHCRYLRHPVSNLP